MCRTVHAVMQTVICGIQMLVRVFMTFILMIENLIRMILQTIYNFISFLLQMLSLIPICVVFMLTSKLKCFMCGGGGPCPVARGGACDCLMSGIAIIIMFLIFRATGILDKIFYALGYAKAPPPPPLVRKFIPTMGDITACSRNDTEEEDTTPLGLDFDTTTDVIYRDFTTVGDNFTGSVNKTTTPVGLDFEMLTTITTEIIYNLLTTTLTTPYDRGNTTGPNLRAGDADKSGLAYYLI